MELQLPPLAETGETLTGAEIAIRCLRAEGVEYVFGYPGGAVLHIYDAIFKQKDVKHILVRHEQGALHAADGYARATGRPGVALVTSGPTHEPIDPVRFIGNRSSGKQGHAIAAALARRGADTLLIAGPTAEPDPPGVQVRHVETAEQMLAACREALPADIAVCAAAVADWKVATSAAQKIKKDGAPPKLEHP